VPVAIRWCGRVSGYETFTSPTVSNGRIALILIPD